MNRTALAGAMAMTILAVGAYLPAGITALFAAKLVCALLVGLLVYMLICEIQETAENAQLEYLESKTEADKALHARFGALGKLLEYMIKAREEAFGEYKQFHTETNKALLAQLGQLGEAVSLKLEEGMRGRQQVFLAKLESMASENGGNHKKIVNALYDNFKYLEEHTEKITSNHLENMTEKMSEVAQDLQNLSRRVTKDIGELNDTLRVTSEGNAKLMKDLADGYKRFETTTEAIIERMASIAREDTELLKELLK